MQTLAQMILMCVVGASEPAEDMLYRLTQAHSQGDPYLIMDLGTGRSYQPADAKEATRIAAHLVDANHDIRLGLAGLSPGVLERHRSRLQDAFEPCTSLRIAGRELDRIRKMKSVRSLKGDDRVHAWAASYLKPHAPMSEAALAFGARVVMAPELSVAKEARSRRPRPGFTYETPHTRLGRRSSAYKAKKWGKKTP